MGKCPKRIHYSYVLFPMLTIFISLNSDYFSIKFKGPIAHVFVNEAKNNQK